MFAKVDIFNMALGHLGISKLVTDVNEESLEAQVLRNFYNVARDLTFRAVDWPWARVTKPLELIEEVPNEEWNFRYRYPIDCANFIRIANGIFDNSSDLTSNFILEQTDAGTNIFAHQREAIGVYIKITDATGVYPSDFVIALSYLLASLSAMALTGGDPMKFGDAAMAKHRMFLSMAAAASKNENKKPMPRSTPSIQARN